MSRTELRAVLSLALIFAMRMLGLFMILPVFSIYAHDLPGNTPLLIGVALGIYGLSQACMQIPFGMLSDKIGRKPVIVIGLCMLALGSVIAAMSHTIYGVIAGRCLQGFGAIGSTLIATIADLTEEENRTKAMAVVGMVIGISFSVALVTGPVLNRYIGVNGIFWTIGGLAALGIVILYGLVPTPKRVVFHSDSGSKAGLFANVLSQPELLRLDFGILVQHAILTALFIVLPLSLQHVGIIEAKQWMVYLPVLVLSFFLMVPFIIIAEKKRQMKKVFAMAIALLAVALLILAQGHVHLQAIIIALSLFFLGFNILEASLPSLVSKAAPAGSKGTAMGVYSTSQFFGIFLGGVLGGWLYGTHHYSGVYYACAGLAILWFLVVLTMPEPHYLSSKLVKLQHAKELNPTQIEQELLAIPGVVDVALALQEEVAYLKVDKLVLDTDALAKWSTSR